MVALEQVNTLRVMAHQPNKFLDLLSLRGLKYNLTVAMEAKDRRYLSASAQNHMELEVVELLALFLETAVMAEITTLADILQTLLAAVLSEENMEARGLTEACLPTITNMEVLLELAAELMEMTEYSLITHKKVGKV